VRRAVESLSRQTYGRFDVILVRHRDMDLSQIEGTAFPNIECIRVVEAPAGKRSTSLWAGLRAVKGEYFSVLDDDDWLFSNHFEALFHPVTSPPPSRFLAYSGVITAEPAPAPIDLPLDWVERKLGRAIEPGQVRRILESLAFGVTEPEPGVFSVTGLRSLHRLHDRS